MQYLGESPNPEVRSAVANTDDERYIHQLLVLGSLVSLSPSFSLVSISSLLQIPLHWILRGSSSVVLETFLLVLIQVPFGISLNPGPVTITTTRHHRSYCHCQHPIYA
jgi:hypothetical protein